MTEKDSKDAIAALNANSPGFEPKNKGGRPSKAELAEPVQVVIDRTAPRAARILEAFIKRRRGATSLSPGLQRACEYIIDHAIGKARQKMEVTGGRMTYLDLANSADDLDKNPRPILVQVAEILKEYADKTGEKKDDVSQDNQPEQG